MEGCRSACLTERIQSSFLLAQDCSSDGAAQLALQDVAVWAFQHKVSFHVGAEKSVALAKQQEVQPILVFPVVGASPQEVCVRPSHRWLGLLWPANHVFLPALLQAVHQRKAMSSPSWDLYLLVVCRLLLDCSSSSPKSMVSCASPGGSLQPRMVQMKCTTGPLISGDVYSCAPCRGGLLRWLRVNWDGVCLALGVQW